MYENYIAIITPFYHGNIDFPSLHVFLETIYKSGTRKIVVGGTTGEGILLTNSEKKSIFTHIRKHFNFEIVGCYSDISVVNFDEDVYNLCDKVMISPQYFIKPNIDSKFDYISNIADKYDKEIIIYNNPSRFCTNIDEELYDKLYEIDNIVGIKEAGNIVDIKKYDKWKWFGGNDDAMDIFQKNGFSGMISAVGNLCPKLLDSAWSDLSYFNAWKNISLAVFESPSPLLIKYYLYKAGIISSYETRFHITDSKLNMKYNELKDVVDNAAE
ncbi:dihydrodipicolinate synthase family protein [Candidatus Cytomitobacter indipagum]|uniref:Dihydrodipicolinate synthase family protein n=1 Tax=Candidatus Cytomitobacter indipagum TaxID=2601575 RepID=A0A5C0UCS8_9PROT|nr:dihydrodipicolinate synthase family protein [Candidatus Cytomitobacter indipagum]QEK37826.1 dihydrodipicolinate synthase family protein [Candidatus Cytomitobacter indipagum]